MHRPPPTICWWDRRDSGLDWYQASEGPGFYTICGQTYTWVILLITGYKSFTFYMLFQVK